MDTLCPCGLRTTRRPRPRPSASAPSTQACRYTYDYANTTSHSPSLNGFGGHAEVTVIPHLRAVVKATFVENSNVQFQYELTAGPNTLRETTFTSGARYFPLRPLVRFQPYAEALLGARYSTGTIAPQNTTYGAGPNQFVYETGAGLMLRLSHRVALMPLEADLLRTLSANGTGIRAELRLSAGLTFRLRHASGD